MQYALALIALLLIWLFIRRRQAKQLEAALKADRRKTVTKNTAYHAVAIRVNGSCCDAARELQGHRFLSNEAPALPLPECTAADCNCRFAHYDDRRSGKDRRTPFGTGGFAAASGKYETERREGKDRRQEPDADSYFR